jgi:tricorn protease
VNRGKIFVTSAEKGTEKGRASFRITDTQSRDGQISWSPDSKKAVYVSDRTGENQIYLYDFQEKKETQLTESSIPANLPNFSPDGKWIAYHYGKDEIRLINAETKESKPFISGIFNWGFNASTSYTWSPDSKWIAFLNRDDNYFNNLYVQNIEETTPKQISFLSHIGSDGVLWSNDGKYIIFNTSQFRIESQIARVDLQTIKPEFREDELDKLFEEEKKEEAKKEDEKEKKDEPTEKKEDEKKKEPEPISIEFDGIRHRLRLLTSPQMNCHAQRISPDSKMLIFHWPMTGNHNLWSICFDEDRKDDPPKQLTFNNGGKWSIYFVPDSRKIYYLDNGRIHYLKIAENGGRDGDPKALESRAEMDTDFEAEKFQMFNEAWRLIRNNFYDPNLHGADWEAVRNRLLPILKGVQAQEDFHELLNLMVGELNASHLGAGGGGGGGMDDAYLGLNFDSKELQSSGLFKVKSILPYGPAALAKEPINVGDYVLSIDGIDINRSIDLSELMKHKVRKRVVLTVNDKSDKENARTVIIQPIDHGYMSHLRYKNWVRENERYVHEKSSGRLGYVHINAMSYEAYMQLLVDLDTETHNKEGVVVDVRYNGGGFIATFILDVLYKRTYIRSAYRDKPPTSATILAGNRIFEKPTILVQNEHSGSNTEMFSEDYRRLGLGKVVGTPTMGAVIWTSNVGLLDGTWFRVPFIKVANIEGDNLELGSREVDVYVERPLGESDENKDSQLDVAIKNLLIQIDGKE